MEKRTFLNFFVFLMFLFLSTCGYYKEGSKVGTDVLEADIGFLEFKSVPPVERDDPFIISYKKGVLDFKKSSGAVFNFSIKCNVEKGEHIGNEFSRLFYKVWLKEGIFNKLYYVDKECFSKSYPKDSTKPFYFICPQLNYLYSSGAQGNTTISIRVNIYNDKMKLIWSGEHAGSIEYKPFKDYIFFSVKSRMPISPEFVVIYILSKDLAEVIKKKESK